MSATHSKKPHNTTLQGTPQLYLPFVVSERSVPSSNCSLRHGGAPELSRSPQVEVLEG